MAPCTTSSGVQGMDALGQWDAAEGLGMLCRGNSQPANTVLDFTAPSPLTFDPEPAPPQMLFSGDLMAVVERG